MLQKFNNHKSFLEFFHTIHIYINFFERLELLLGIEVLSAGPGPTANKSLLALYEVSKTLADSFFSSVDVVPAALLLCCSFAIFSTFAFCALTRLTKGR